MDAKSNRTLVTGFLAFEGFAINPSALLAQSSGRPFELLDVSYAAVDEFLERLDANRFDRLLMIGVAGKSSRMRIETVARNVVGARPDVRGETTIGTIDPSAPETIVGALWSAPEFSEATKHRHPSEDAGDYLCNYIYYRALQRFGKTKRVGFLHVPPLEQMALEIQQSELAMLLELIER